MFASLINGIVVAVCGILGAVFKKHINEKYTSAVLTALAIVVSVIGMKYAIGTDDVLGVIVCIAIGTFLGEILRIEDRLENLGDTIKTKLIPPRFRDDGFVESFVAGSLLFCVGSMAIVGSMEAGINGNTTIILSKTVIDGIAALSFAVTLGVGVVFAGLSIFLYQGALTMLAVWVAPYLTDVIVTEMSAVGGILMLGIAINMLGLKKIKVGNMLPAMFLPILYQPLAAWIGTFF